VGLLNFACKINPLAKIFLKRINRSLRELARNCLRDLQVSLSPDLRLWLSFWLRQKALESHIPWRSPPPFVDLFMDASKVGWGFHTTDHQEGRGRWSQPIATSHINVKEFVAVWIALQRCKWKEGTSIRLHSNNTSVVNCLNRGGSTRLIPLWSWTLIDSSFSGFEEMDPAAVCVPMPGPSSSGSGRHVNQLEQMDVDLHLSSSQGSPNGTRIPSSFQGESYAHSSLVANTILVFRTSQVVFQHQGIPQSSPVATRARQNSFLQLLFTMSLTRMDFLMDIYSNLYGVHAAQYLLKSHRQSTRRQYETAWKSGVLCKV